MSKKYNLDDIINMDLTDPENLPKTNLEKPSPFSISPLGKWWNANSLPDFEQRMAAMKSAKRDAAGIIPEPIKQPAPTPIDFDLYEKNLEMLGLGIPGPAQEVITEAPVKELNPRVKEYLLSKRGPAIETANGAIQAPNQAELDQPKTPSIMDRFSDENYAKTKTEAEERNSNLGWAQFAAGVGNALARRDPNEVNNTFDKIRERNKDETIGEFNRQKASAISDIDTRNKIDMNDPNSAKSKILQSQIARLYPNAFTQEEIAQFTLADQASILKPLELKAALDARKEERADRNSDRAFQREQLSLTKELARDEKMMGLKTPYGIANTVDDAKQLKEAHESKQSFDSKISEMISLRKKYGGETFNREAVARGKQLSKDLLLEYKNMAKLGVLSKSDEDIINAIIPADPLEFKLEGLAGQDSILHKLESFKKDSDRDFQTRVQTRTRSGQAPTQSEVERKTPDGRVAIFDAATKKFIRYK